MHHTFYGINISAFLAPLSGLALFPLIPESLEMANRLLDQKSEEGPAV